MLVVSLLCSVPALFDLSRNEAAIGLGVLTVLPALIITLRTGRLLIADPIVVLGIMWFLALTLPVLAPLVDAGIYRDASWYTTTPWALDTAALWMYRGWAACCVGYWGVGVIVRPGPGRRPSQTELQIADRMRVLAGIVGLIGSSLFIVMTGGQSYTHLEGFATASSLAMVVGELKIFALIYIFLHFHARGRGRLLTGESHLLLAILGVQILIFGASSSKTGALEIGAAWALGNASGAARNLLRELAIGAAALGFVYCTFYVVTVYREEIRMRAIAPGAPIGEVVSQQLDAVSVAIEGLIQGRPIGYGDDRYDSGNMLDRLAHVGAFGMVLDHTAGYPPYENAWTSLAAPILAFIPRDLVGEKTAFMNSGAFAAQFLGWEFGGLAISLPGSFFWAWGYEGIVFGMMGIGVLLAALYRGLANDGPTGLIAKASMLRLVVAMLDVGGEFQPLMIGLTRTLALLMVIWIIARHLRFSGRPSAARP